MSLRGKQANGLVTQQRVLRAAVAQFLEKGYTGTTTADITGAAGIAQSSFFHVFPSKEALLLDMKPNRFVPEIQEPIFGSFFVCGLGEEDLIGLTDEQLERFDKKFHYPQLFTMAENCCIVTDYRPEDLTQPQEPIAP